MRSILYCALVTAFVVACSSNQSANPDKDKIYKTVKETALTQQSQQKTSETSEKNGKLTDNQIKAYIAVQIKKEQIRYTLEFSQLEKANAIFRGENADRALENEAVKELELDQSEYLWVRKTIKRSLGLLSRSESVVKDVQNNAVLMHNIAILEEHKDGLDFARRYKLPSKSDRTELAEGDLDNQNSGS